MAQTSSKQNRFSESHHWLWDTESDHIRISPSFYRRFKSYPERNSLTTAEWCSFFVEDGRKDIEDTLDNFRRGAGDSTLSYTGLIPDGNSGVFHTRCTGQTIEFNNGKPRLVSGQIAIMTGSQLPDAPEIDDSYLLELIMAQFPYSIFFKDTDGRFIKINSECAKKFGLKDPGEAVGKTDYDFFDEIHANKASKDEKRIIESGESIIGQLEKEVLAGSEPSIHWASTTKLPLYDSGNNIIGTFGITKDVTDKIEAEAALKESENKYRSIFENIQDVYYRTNRQGILTEISPSVKTYSGLSREDVIGKPVSNFYYYKRDRERLIERLKQNGVVTDFEVRIANTRDELLYSSVSAKIVRNDAADIIAVEGIMRDITQRKLADIKLKETHHFFDQILNNTNEGIYVINSDFEYIYWNSMMEKISGMPSDDVLGEKPFDLFPHVNHEKLTDKLKKAMSGKTVKSADYFYEIESSGNKGWAHAYYTPLRNKEGKIDNVLVAISDISERKKAEEKLRKSDETLNKLSEQVPGAIYQFQQYPDGSSCFPFVSKAFKNVYELEPGEVSKDAKKAVDRIHPDDLESVIASINDSFNTLEPWELDYRVQLPIRGLRWLRGRARPEKQPDGSVIWHGYLSDITDKKKQENDLNETLKIVSDQNSRLMNFAHIVSHNLRNHAGNISALLSLIESETSEEEKLQLFNYLNMASTRLNEAIKDLNDIIDQQSGSTKNISKVNVGEFFEKIREILSTEIIVHNVKFDVSIDEDCTIDYNPAYLESILLNLISNAIKYRHPDRDPLISVTFENSDEGPTLTIRDNGQGIDLSEHRENLFGMYNTFHENEDSKGIGLYITKNQVDSMGGSIDVESRVGDGSAFRINLICDLSRIQQEAR